METLIKRGRRKIRCLNCQKIIYEDRKTLSCWEKEIGGNEHTCFNEKDKSLIN